jgi:hypothetical protein
LEVKAIGIELKDQHVNKPSTTPLIRGSSGSVLQTASFGVCTKLALQNRSQTSSWSSSISCS